MLQYVNMVFSVLISVFYIVSWSSLKFQKSCSVVWLPLYPFSDLIFLGAQLNNDCLMTLFVSWLFLHTALAFWSQYRKHPENCCCYHFATLSKTSGVLIAPGVGAVFLYHLIKTRIEKRCLNNISCLPWSAFRFPFPGYFGTWFCMVCHFLCRRCNRLCHLAECGRLWLCLPHGLSHTPHFTAHTIDWWDLSNSANIWGQTILTLLYDEGILVFRTSFWEMLAPVFTLLGFALSLILFCTSTSYCFPKQEILPSDFWSVSEMVPCWSVISSSASVIRSSVPWTHVTYSAATPFWFLAMLCGGCSIPAENTYCLNCCFCF